VKGAGGIPLSPYVSFTFTGQSRTFIAQEPKLMDFVVPLDVRRPKYLLVLTQPSSSIFSPPSFPLLFGTGPFVSVNVFPLLLDALNYSGHFTSRNVSTFFGICFPLLTFYLDTEPFGLEAYADDILLGRKNKLNGLFIRYSLSLRCRDRLRTGLVQLVVPLLRGRGRFWLGTKPRGCFD